MNRREVFDLLARYLPAIECPDCGSDVYANVPDDGGAVSVLVEHDETCPWYRARYGDAS